MKSFMPANFPFSSPQLSQCQWMQGRPSGRSMEVSQSGHHGLLGAGSGMSCGREWLCSATVVSYGLGMGIKSWGCRRYC